jgi:hypothetical protein
VAISRWPVPVGVAGRWILSGKRMGQIRSGRDSHRC